MYCIDYCRKKEGGVNKHCEGEYSKNGDDDETFHVLKQTLVLSTHTKHAKHMILFANFEILL